MNLLFKVPGLPLGTCRRWLFGRIRGADVLRQTLFQLFADTAVVQQADEFGPVHGVESLEQRTPEKILVIHDLLPARNSCLAAAAHPVSFD
jgi:hypothetical protein